jgi:uncharacterized membrane protein (UPF0182 family)
MKVKVFQKNGYSSDKELSVKIEKEINEWLTTTRNIRITDAQIASSVIVKPGRQMIYVQALCILMYEQEDKESTDSLRYTVKLIADTVIHNRPMEREFKIQSVIDDWINTDLNVTIQLVRIASDSASWSDDNGYYWYCYHYSCLLISQ